VTARAQLLASPLDKDSPNGQSKTKKDKIRNNSHNALMHWFSLNQQGGRRSVEVGNRIGRVFGLASKGTRGRLVNQAIIHSKGSAQELEDAQLNLFLETEARQGENTELQRNSFLKRKHYWRPWTPRKWGEPFDSMPYCLDSASSRQNQQIDIGSAQSFACSAPALPLCFANEGLPPPPVSRKVLHKHA
jgi:hypothetical protein